MRRTGHEQNGDVQLHFSRGGCSRISPLRPVWVMVDVALKALGRASPALGHNWGGGRAGVFPVNTSWTEQRD